MVKKVDFYLQSELNKSEIKFYLLTSWRQGLRIIEWLRKNLISRGFQNKNKISFYHEV